MNELRSVVAANPDDTNAELELVNLLGAVKGPDAARAELLARIKARPRRLPVPDCAGEVRLRARQGRRRASRCCSSLLPEAARRPRTRSPRKTRSPRSISSQQQYRRGRTVGHRYSAADARNINGLRLRAAIHLARNQVDDAIADLRSALNDQPRSPELLADPGAAYERNGSIELAGKAFFDAMKASNYSPAVGLAYVAFLQRRGVTSQVESVLIDLANRNPNSVPVLSALARVKLTRQDWVGAHAIADAITEARRQERCRRTRSTPPPSAGRENLPTAWRFCRTAYSAHPGAIRPMVDLVNVYVQIGPDQPGRNLHSLGADRQSGECRSAGADGLDSACEERPGAGRKVLQVGDREKAGRCRGLSCPRRSLRPATQDRRCTSASSSKASSSSRAISGCSLRSPALLEAKRDYDGAIAEYESMLKDQPGSLIVANNLASLLADHRTDKASLERANSLAQLLKNSDIPQFKDTLGWVSYQRQDYRSALTLLEDAAKALPNLAMVRYHLGMTYLATGQDDKAADEFKKARDARAQ